MKQFKTISLLVLLLIMGQNVLASNTIPGVGVVVKKNPGGGASRATTDKAGNFSLELVKGSYLISLDKNQLLTAGQLLVAAQNPKSNYIFNGDGTQMVITENDNIIMSQLESDAGTDLLLITVIKPTTLQGTVQWDSSVMENPKPTSSNYVGHVTLLRKNTTSFVTQVFCPTGTVGLGGKCVPIKELENSAAYVGHVTLLRKNAASTISIKPTNGVCPDGYTLKDGICVLATNASELQAQTEEQPVRGQIVKAGKVKNETGTSTSTVGMTIVEESLDCKCCGKTVSGTFGDNITHTKACCKPKQDSLKKVMLEEINTKNRQDGGNVLVRCSCCKEYFKDDEEFLNHNCSKSCLKITLPNKGDIKNIEMKIWSDGSLTQDGILIVKGKTIVGSITGLKKPAEIKIEQKESNDIGIDTTDKNGNFMITVKKDTLHKIYVDGVEFGKIKIVTSNETGSTTHSDFGVVDETLNCKCCGKEIKGALGEILSHIKTCCPKKDTASMIAMQEEITTRYMDKNGNVEVECPCCSSKMDISKINRHARECCRPVTEQSTYVKVPNTGKIKGTEIKVIGDGTTTSDGTPIVGRIILGTVSGLKNPSEIKIEQAESSDIGTATTDQYGNFVIRVSKDTIHKVYINNIEYGKIKIIKGKNDEPQAIRSGGKCTKLVPLCGVDSKDTSCVDCDQAHRLICGFKEVVTDCPPASAATSTARKLIDNFVYDDDYTIDNVELTSVLGITSFTIKKGIYTVDRSNPNQGGKIVFPIVRPIPVTKAMKTEGQLFKGTNPKGVDCKMTGNSCFYVSENNDAKTLQEFVMKPIIEKGMCTKIEVSYRGSGSPKNQGF